MNEMRLLYEDITIEPIDPPTHLLVNNEDGAEYLCEATRCLKPAVDEWVSRDSEGTYYTYRCEDHGVTDEEDMARYLRRNAQ